jgi:hypothetical protein
LSHNHPVHTFTSHDFRIHLNIILSCTSRLPKFPSHFPLKNVYAFLVPPVYFTTQFNSSSDHPKSTNHEASQCAVCSSPPVNTSSLPGINTLFGTPLSESVEEYSTLRGERPTSYRYSHSYVYFKSVFC